MTTNRAIAAGPPPKEQARNRTDNVLYEHEGKSYLLMDLAEEKGISYRTLDARIRRQGMSVEEALAKPTENRGREPTVEVNGVMVSKSQAARDAGMSYCVLHRRLSKGMSVEEALATPVAPRKPRTKK